MFKLKNLSKLRSVYKNLTFNMEQPIISLPKFYANVNKNMP